MATTTRAVAVKTGPKNRNVRNVVQEIVRANVKKPTTVTSRKTSIKTPLATYEAPPDFKPHFLEVTVRTEKDGLLASSIKATRYQGRYDPDVADNKKADLGSYDIATLIGIQARLAGFTYRSNAEKKLPVQIKERNRTEKIQGKPKLVYRTAHRLPPNTVFRILFRVSRKAADGSLSIGMKQVEQIVKSEINRPTLGKVKTREETGRTKIVLLEKTDPVFRMFLRARRILPAAFKNVMLPPKRIRGKKVEQSED